MSASEPLPARSTTKTVVIAALALVVTFIAGFVVGAVVDRLFLLHGRPHRPPPMAAHVMINRLDRHLDLTDPQREQIRTILERRHEGINRVVRAEIEKTNAEIEKVLTPGQREKFQELKLRLGERMHRGGKRRRESTR